jgi:hypothetical protein
MSLTLEERNIIVELEKEKSLSTFAEIDVLLSAKLWNNIAGRLYYAAFHAVSALLVSEGHAVGTHQGAVVQLHQFYVKTGLLSKEYGSFYSQLQTLREKSDYNCSYNASEDDILPRIPQTKSFIDAVIGLIRK